MDSFMLFSDAALAGHPSEMASVSIIMQTVFGTKFIVERDLTVVGSGYLNFGDELLLFVCIWRTYKMYSISLCFLRHILNVSNYIKE